MVEKNYRLQDIQLSKSPLSPLGFSGKLCILPRELADASSSAGEQTLNRSRLRRRPPASRWRQRPHRRSGVPSVARAVSAPTFAEATVGLLRLVQQAKAGGEYRARTGDLLVANQALSQLS